MKTVLYLSLLLAVNITSAQFIEDKDPLSKVNKLAIQPERTISFSTSEGTNMHVDISPDGRTILFTLLGDIYSVPSSGGVATQLTRGLAVNDYPVWSPDGKRIAYTSDASGVNALQVMDAQGKRSGVVARKLPENYLTKFTGVKWCTDGLAVLSRNKIFYLSGGSADIQDSLQQVLGFSSDGQWLYSLNYLENGWKIVRYHHSSLANKTELVFRNCQGRCELINPRISPDGRWLTYIKGVKLKRMDSLMIIDLTNGHERSLVPLNITYAGFFEQQHYSFSADAKELFIGYHGKIHKIKIASGKNEIIPFTANVNVDMGPLRYHTFKVPRDSFDVKYIRSAHSSPDGKTLVFSALNRIYLKDLPNGIPRRLYDQSFAQFHPAWSPDGKWITYVTWNDTSGGHVWKMPINGGKPQRLTTVASLYSSPSWSPDGKLIVVSKGLRNDYTCDKGQIEYINVETRNIQIVARNVPLSNQPKFSSDGQYIYFQPGKIDDNAIFLPKLIAVNLVDTSLKVIANGRGDRGPLRKQIQLSPDGRYIVFSRNENIFLEPVFTHAQPSTIYDYAAKLPVIRLTQNGIDPHWEKGGKILSWSFADKYFQIDPDKIVDASLAARHDKNASALVETETIDVTVTADRVISIDLKAAINHSKGTIAFKNARIITMGPKNVIENGCLIIKDGRFIAVGESNSITVPQGATIMDMKGKSIMPGLIDMHHHMGAPGEIIPNQYWKYSAMLAYGVTTARDPAGNHEKFGYAELTAASDMRGPRMYHVGNPVRSDYYFVSPLEAELIAINRAQMNGTVIKHYVQPARIQQEWLLIAADKAQLNMTNEGSYYFLDEIGMLKDGCAGIEHNPNWGETYKDVITLFAKSGTYLTPALQTSYSHEFEQHPKYYFRQKYLRAPEEKYMRFTSDQYVKLLRESIAETEKTMDTVTPNFLPESQVDAAISKAGGHVLMGSHGEDQGIGVHFELWALQMGGLSNMEALHAATIAGAEGLGIQQDIGSIETGKIADILILDKNPLEEIHNSRAIRYVVKGGILYDSNTLDILWPFKQKMPEFQLP